MDPNNHHLQTLENPETAADHQNEVGAVVPCCNSNAMAPPPLPLATASISLSLSALLPSNPLLHKQQPPLKISSASSASFHHTNTNTISRNPTRVGVRVKIPPTQVYTLSHAPLSLSLPRMLFPAIQSNSTIAANPLQSPLTLGPRRSSDPSNAAALRRASIVWFRNDLRVLDNECLTSANSHSMSVLPVYCFDPRDYGKSSSGFDKTGPYRASFLLQSVSDLRRSLQSKGSDLVVRIGPPESVLLDLAKSVGADAVYAHREVSRDEVHSEEKIQAAMNDEGVEVNFLWGSTLYHIDDLPFRLEEMPSNYGGFKEKVQKLQVRKTIAALDRLKGMPSRGDVEPGEIPSLQDLGLNPNPTMSQDVKPAINASMVGGETEALQKLKKFADECQAQPPKVTNGSKDSIYGANFSCKISPWLAMGCLSPRTMFDELKKTASRKISARKDDGGAPSDTGMNWLMYELLWRDFFRFITKKYSSTKKQLDAAPVTACTGALA